MRKYIFITLIAFISGGVGAWTFMNMYYTPAPTLEPELQITQARYEAPSRSFASTDVPNNFVEASEKSTRSVVYIKNISEKSYSSSYLDWFFDRNPQSQTRISSGSGVIFSSDGYIVTNNHVVQDADKLEVVYNKNNYTATLVGTDPSTDLAVLKINEKNLPAITLGSSKDLRVGEWVIAVGNPFNLTSTVTAGIVSAKGREINILQSKFPIESFIQTDAAINPGNSGGALINQGGELIGINTAILSRTGYYAGYGFAVPIDIVRKIVDDLIKYGEVQKAFFGGEVSDFNAAIARRLDIKIPDEQNIRGVLLGYLQENGAAAQAGLEEEDIILSINGEEVNTRSQFEEELSYHSPGDKISVTYLRNGKTGTTSITLTNREGTTEILNREIFTSESLGAQFESVSKVEREMLELEYGVKVFNIRDGLIKRIGITENFIITDINRYPIKEPSELAEILKKIRGRVIVEGMNDQGRRGYYSFELR
jgi:Do/DeqQ family serine protease